MQEEGQAKEKALSMGNGERVFAIYSEIRDKVLHQIKNIDLDGSFGTKIDTIARHILWIREHDPGAKSIVFSQYRDFLDVLARAFSQFRIDFTGIDRKDGIHNFVSAHVPGLGAAKLPSRAASPTYFATRGTCFQLAMLTPKCAGD